MTSARKRVAVLILGHLGNFVMVYGYDFVVYPYLLLTFGLVQGWIYAVIGSLLLCLGTLWFYDITKQDWLGIETIKLLRDEEPVGRARKFFYHLMNKGDMFAFIFLCLKYDPFIVTVYMRRGSSNHAMTRRDWKVFWASMLVSNLWWGLAVFGAIEFIQAWIAPFIQQMFS